MGALPGRPDRLRTSAVEGFRDLLPEAAEALRETQEAILGEMRRWGYRFVATPALESLDVVTLGLEPDEVRRLFKFADADGGMVALVGERTVPVARLVAGKLRSAALPLRLCYAGPVHSSDPARFGRREAQQTGAELIGAPGAAAHAEVIAMAVRCLDAVGLRGYQVDVGHSEFFLGLLHGLDVAPDARAAIRQALASRDLVALERALDGTRLQSAEQDLLLRFPALRGGIDILDAAGALVTNPRSERALAELRQVAELLRVHGVAAPVSLDLGAIRDFDYYTGVTFEAFGSDLGRPLATGGRYDGLLERFGRAAPATGFVIDLGLLAEAVARTEGAPSLPPLTAAISWSQGGLEDAIRTGDAVRRFGMRAVVSTEAGDPAAAAALAEVVGARHALHCRGDGEVLLPGGERVALDGIVARLARAGSA